jgi:hypothetical protein
MATFELSEKELQIIEGWYVAVAGESAHDRTFELFALLEKLNMKASHRDLWAPNPDNLISECRDEI